MAKYIGKFADIAALQTAVEHGSISRPFVALTEDNDKVVYGPKLDLAKVGDIAVFGVAEDQIYYIKQANYNTTDFPAAAYVPIGVVCKDQSYRLSQGLPHTVRIMNLKWLSNTSLDSGSDSRVAFSCLNTSYNHPNIISLANVSQDLEGETYSNYYIERKTNQPNWKTDETLSGDSSDSGGMPFAVAWRWKTPGTSNGDWYIPSAGEIYEIVTDSIARSIFNTGLNMVNGRPLDTSPHSVYGLFTSSFITPYSDVVNAYDDSFLKRKNATSYCRAICALYITELKK